MVAAAARKPSRVAEFLEWRHQSLWEVKGMLSNPSRIIAICLLILACNMARAECRDEMGGGGDIIGRVIWLYDIDHKMDSGRYVVDIVQPQDKCPAYLAFKLMSETYPTKELGTIAKETDFELAQPGTAQLGLHLVELNREYLVVESASAIGWLGSDIYIIRDGKPTLLRSVGSEHPPIFTRIDKQDFVQITNPAKKIKRIPLLRRK